jgi:hypothetical protein
MISIHYIIGQISPNLFKVDATTFQSAIYDVEWGFKPLTHWESSNSIQINIINTFLYFNYF